MDILLHEKTIKGKRFTYANDEEFRETCMATFRWGFYRFRTKTKEPLIIDCGAHIGISLLYFKMKYPQARVIGFEANPDTFKLLEKNIAQNHLSGVKLVQAAVSDQEGMISFYVGKDNGGELTQWGDAGVQNKWNTSNRYTAITVPSVQLSSYIEQPVDFLKLNIEGMEGIVLKDIEPKLYLVKKLRIEYHGSSTNSENKLEEVLSLLEQHGFRYVLEQYSKVVGLTQIERNDPYFLNIYTYRQPLPWWWHRYAWYLLSRVRVISRSIRWQLARVARRLRLKR